jgi:hypothetical protein
VTSDRETLVEIGSRSEDCGANGVESSKRAELFKPWAAKRVKMTLNQFSSFAAVAKHLNLTKASAELRVSQPSLSLQFKAAGGLPRNQALSPDQCIHVWFNLRS